jgi:HEAT repeat protein
MSPTYDELVTQLEQVDGKEQTIMALRTGGEDAKPALLRGLSHPAWRVRNGCLRVLDHTVVDDATRVAVVRALDDPHRKVRRAAVHLLGCEVCKPAGYCGIEGVDLEAVHLDLVMRDRSGAVRRSAMGHFMWKSALSDRVTTAMRELVAGDTDEGVRRRAASALAYPSIASMPKGAARAAKYTETAEALLA